MTWQKEGENVTTPPRDAIGFVYSIMFSNGMKYIGKKNFYSKRKRKFGKKEAALVTDKRKKLYEIVTKESNWKTYTSSNIEVKKLIDSGLKYSKRIVCYAYTPKELTFLEVKWMFNLGVLSPYGDWLNDNILGKFFKKEIEQWALTKR